MPIHVSSNAPAETDRRSAAEHGAQLFRRPVDDGRHEDFGAAHPGDGREHQQQRIGVLPFAEGIRAEVARQHAANDDRHGDLRDPFQPEPDDIRKGARHVRIGEASGQAFERQHAAPARLIRLICAARFDTAVAAIAHLAV
jgi:hypothetical protein